MFYYDATTKTVTFNESMNILLQPDQAIAWAALDSAASLREIAEKLSEISSELNLMDNTIAGK